MKPDPNKVESPLAALQESNRRAAATASWSTAVAAMGAQKEDAETVRVRVAEWRLKQAQQQAVDSEKRVVAAAEQLANFVELLTAQQRRHEEVQAATAQAHEEALCELREKHLQEATRLAAVIDDQRACTCAAEAREAAAISERDEVSAKLAAALAAAAEREAELKARLGALDTERDAEAAAQSERCGIVESRAEVAESRAEAAEAHAATLQTTIADVRRAAEDERREAAARVEELLRAQDEQTAETTRVMEAHAEKLAAIEEEKRALGERSRALEDELRRTFATLEAKACEVETTKWELEEQMEAVQRGADEVQAQLEATRTELIETKRSKAAVQGQLLIALEAPPKIVTASTHAQTEPPPPRPSQAEASAQVSPPILLVQAVSVQTDPEPIVRVAVAAAQVELLTDVISPDVQHAAVQAEIEEEEEDEGEEMEEEKEPAPATELCQPKDAVQHEILENLPLVEVEAEATAWGAGRFLSRALVAANSAWDAVGGADMEIRKARRRASAARLAAKLQVAASSGGWEARHAAKIAEERQKQQSTWDAERRRLEIVQAAALEAAVRAATLETEATLAASVADFFSSASVRVTRREAFRHWRTWRAKEVLLARVAIVSAEALRQWRRRHGFARALTSWREWWYLERRSLKVVSVRAQRARGRALDGVWGTTPFPKTPVANIAGLAGEVGGSQVATPVFATATGWTASSIPTPSSPVGAGVSARAFEGMSARRRLESAGWLDEGETQMTLVQRAMEMAWRLGKEDEDDGRDDGKQDEDDGRDDGKQDEDDGRDNGSEDDGSANGKGYDDEGRSVRGREYAVEDRGDAGGRSDQGLQDKARWAVESHGGDRGDDDADGVCDHGTGPESNAEDTEDDTARVRPSSTSGTRPSDLCRPTPPPSLLPLPPPPPNPSPSFKRGIQITRAVISFSHAPLRSWPAASRPILRRFELLIAFGTFAGRLSGRRERALASARHRAERLVRRVREALSDWWRWSRVSRLSSIERRAKLQVACSVWMQIRPPPPVGAARAFACWQARWRTTCEEVSRGAGLMSRASARSDKDGCRRALLRWLFASMGHGDKRRSQRRQSACCRLIATSRSQLSVSRAWHAWSTRAVSARTLAAAGSYGGAITRRAELRHALTAWRLEIACEAALTAMTRADEQAAQQQAEVGVLASTLAAELEAEELSRDGRRKQSQRVRAALMMERGALHAKIDHQRQQTQAAAAEAGAERERWIKAAEKAEADGRAEGRAEAKAEAEADAEVKAEAEAKAKAQAAADAKAQAEADVAKKTRTASTAWQALVKQNLGPSTSSRLSTEVSGLRDQLEWAEDALDAAGKVAEVLRGELNDASAESSRLRWEASLLRAALEAVEQSGAHHATTLRQFVSRQADAEKALGDELRALATDGEHAAAKTVEALSHAMFAHEDIQWQKGHYREREERAREDLLSAHMEIAWRDAEIVRKDEDIARKIEEIAQRDDEVTSLLLAPPAVETRDAASSPLLEATTDEEEEEVLAAEPPLPPPPPVTSPEPQSFNEPELPAIFSTLQQPTGALVEPVSPPPPPPDPRPAPPPTRRVAHHPSVEKLSVELPAPASEDDVSPPVRLTSTRGHAVGRIVPQPFFGHRASSMLHLADDDDGGLLFFQHLHRTAGGGAPPEFKTLFNETQSTKAYRQQRLKRLVHETEEAALAIAAIRRLPRGAKLHGLSPCGAPISAPARPPSPMPSPLSHPASPHGEAEQNMQRRPVALPRVATLSRRQSAAYLPSPLIPSSYLLSRGTSFRHASPAPPSNAEEDLMAVLAESVGRSKRPYSRLGEGLLPTAHTAEQMLKAALSGARVKRRNSMVALRRPDADGQEGGGEERVRGGEEASILPQPQRRLERPGSAGTCRPSAAGEFLSRLAGAKERYLRAKNAASSLPSSAIGGRRSMDAEGDRWPSAFTKHTSGEGDADHADVVPMPTSSHDATSPILPPPEPPVIFPEPSEEQVIREAPVDVLDEEDEENKDYEFHGGGA